MKIIYNLFRINLFAETSPIKLHIEYYYLLLKKVQSKSCAGLAQFNYAILYYLKMIDANINVNCMHNCLQLFFIITSFVIYFKVIF